jgi:CRISPR-associated endonuclease/helicase Cas3
VSAPELEPDDFRAFFRAVHGANPFPWQTRLLRRVAEEGVWPDVLDLPTGSGKTAALDIGVFHLALEAPQGQTRRAPVRIAFVVDRRLIVDDAFERARKLNHALANSSDPVVTRVAAALRCLSGEDQPPLVIRSLRGGAPREDDWARTPAQPTVLCSTVDQAGSRLLFRGYGVSDRMKPIHAGLLGSDSLILLDEAHLSEPFRQTLASLERLRRGDDTPWTVALMTATPGQRANRPFGLHDDDRDHPVLSRRLKAPKPARLIDIPGKQGVTAEVQRVEAIVEQAKAALGGLKKSGVPNPAVGVVVNRVARARQVFNMLKTELDDAEVILVIGPARSVDREERARAQLGGIRTNDPDATRVLDRSLIVVATQTIEAGVDIDLDGLVTEAAALDALRQRFGRLNRAGRFLTPVASVVAHRDDIAAKADDPIYRDRISRTWAELSSLASDRVVDFGLEAFAGRLTSEQAVELAAPREDAPVLLPAYADLWSHTSPIPNADPEVGLFLHGPDRSPASVQIVWRADIRRDDLIPRERDRLIELLGLVPPRSGEAIEVPLWAARAWLGENHEPLANLSDAADRAPEEDPTGLSGRPALRYAGRDDSRSGVVQPEELRSGDLVVVPAAYGGCDEWGWDPKSTKPVMDIAEAGAWPYRARRFAVRVTPGLIQQEVLRHSRETGSEPAPDLDAIPGILSSILAAHAEATAPVLLDAVMDAAGDLHLPQELRTYLEALRDRKGRLERVFAYNYYEEEHPLGVVFVAPRGLRHLQDADQLAATPSTESDELGSAGGYAQRLDEHSKEVEAFAHRFGRHAGLEEAVTADLALAAYLHDAGKADPRFQAYLAGGDPLGWDGEHVLAKSGRASLPRNARGRAGLPEHWRHEALSVRMAQLHARFGEGNDPALVLWLIGVHHGYGRPLYPHADPLDAEPRQLPHALNHDWCLEPGHGPQSLAFEFRGRDWAQMFEDLKRRYGIWGLARLEAFVRLADHRASEAAARGYTEESAR